MRALCVICIVLMSAVSVLAQDLGILSGKVLDEMGEALPGANIVVKGPALDGIRGTTADGQGAYRIERLPLGVYEVTVSFVGYETAVITGVQILAGARVIQDFSLNAESLVGQQIVVSASRRPEKVLDAPASVAVVDADEIRDRHALSVGDYVKSMPGVDHSQTGLAQNNTVIRGFNNIFSGAVLMLVDNRIARVPSLRLNANHFIPITGEDIERIELVLGPGSALYGPNSANGVMHIITRSPFGSEGNMVSVSGGERSVRKASMRHASSFNDKVGIKVSGEYFAGDDWEYVDPVEVQSRGSNPRDYGIERRAGEVRLDYRPTDELTLIGSGGYTSTSSIELTGQGAVQADNWKYSFLQGRLLYQGWFAQVFYNKSDAGDTRLLRSNNPIVDKSSVLVFQLQHNASLGEKQQFTYGADVLRTRPKTEGTIHGANEDNDDINEYGVYLQSETNLSDQVEVVLAGRMDEHNHIEDPVFSPRAALVIKPAPEHTLRFTYNRAFGTPSSLNLFLDLVASPDAYGLGQSFSSALGYSPAIDIRTQGSTTGFTFPRDSGGLPMFRSPFAPVAGLPTDQYFPLHDPLFTNVMWGVARGAVLAELVPKLQLLATGIIAQQLIAAGVPADQAPGQAAAQAALLAAAFPGIVPAALPGLQNAVAMFNAETQGFDAVTSLNTAVTNLKKIEPTITETFEIGYKGIVENKLVLAADFYRTKIKDFVGPLRVETPNVFLDATSLSTVLAGAFAQALQDPANAQLAAAAAALDDPSLGLGGNSNGSSVDELTTIFTSTAARIPFGTMSVEQATDPAAVMLTYRNFGSVTLYGADLAFAYYPNDMWTFTGNFSYVSEDLFPNLDNIGDIALNAPKQKFNLGLSYKFPNTALKVGGKVRYRGEFPMNSGVYVGSVGSYTVVDLNAAYELPLSDDRMKVTFSVEAGNVLDKGYQSFVGVPEIGRLVSGGLTVRF